MKKFIFIDQTSTDNIKFVEAETELDAQMKVIKYLIESEDVWDVIKERLEFDLIEIEELSKL